MARAHTSHEFWNLRDSLRRAKARADRYFKEKRMLETKVRDLERSRDSWKMKFTRLAQAEPNPAPSPLLPELPGLQPAGDLRIRGQHFSSFVVMLAVRFYLSGTFRYRAAGRILSHCAAAFPGLPCPSFDSVRLWMLRIGLGRLLSAGIGPRWLMICDHTATYGGLKMLVVGGVDLALLEQRVADGTGDFSIGHRDIQPLAVVPMKHSSGGLILEIAMRFIGKHGNPERMVTDGGSDIMKFARLLAEYQKSRGEEPTRHTYDISHRIARIVEAELAASAEWNKLEEFVTKARVYCKYRARHLSPPSLRHGPDRWMNVTGIVGWMGRLKDRIASSARDARDQLANGIGSYRQSPRFGFTQRIWEAAKKAYDKRDGVFNALKRMCGKEYPSQQAYEKELGERCPALPGEVKDRLDADNDLNRTYLEDVSAGSEPCWAIHREVVGMLAFSNAIQKHLKTAGLSKAELKTCRAIHEQSALTGAGERIGREIMAVLEDMAKDLGDEERIVVTSDVIESLNGRWKMLINGAAMPALGVNALLMPALMGELSPQDVKEALEAVSMADVENWKKKTLGLTFFQEKRSPVRKPRPENLREAIP